METLQVTPGKMLVSVVEEVDEISEEDAKHIQMFFGCAKCKQSFSDAKEVLLHVRNGQCPGSGNSSNDRKPQSSAKKRGRPKKSKTPADEVSSAKKAKKTPDTEDTDFIPTPVNLPNERRATRVSTGVMKRKSILDIIGEASARKDAKLIDKGASSSDENEPVVRRGPGRPKKMREEPSVVVTITEHGFETEPLKGNLAPDDGETIVSDKQTEMLADTGEQYIVMTDGSNVVEATEMVLVQENELENLENAEQEAAEAVEVTEPAENVAESHNAEDVAESEDANDANESESNLLEHIGDGDNDEDDYAPEGQEEFAEEDQEYEEEMEDELKRVLGEQLKHAKVTQMGGTRVIEIMPSAVQLNQLEIVNKAPVDETKTTIVKIERPDWDEPAEDIELKLEDLEDAEYQDGARKKSRGKPKRDAYTGYTKSKYMPKRSLRCPKCPQRFFMTKNELDIHISCHVSDPTEEIQYKCPDCAYQTRLWNRCLDHLITHDVYKEKFKDHDFVRNILGQYECPVCKKKFDRKNNMKGHVLKVHQKSSKMCGVCQQVFESMDEKTFNRHVERCKGVEHSCPHCKYKTVISENYRKHLKIHNGTGFTCPICAKVFPTKSRFRSHLGTHDQNRAKTVCDICGQEFMTEDAAKKHIVRAHAEVSELYQCYKCSYTAKLESDLKKHITSVHFKKFNCDQCEYSTNSESAYEQHKQYHAPGRRFACTWSNCFYSGATPKHLSNHICQVHQPLSKHQCPVCMKCYKKKTHLARHLVVHTGEKPYVCLDCNEAFASHSTYYRHRARTGHDAKREGIVSVPQNIHIQYINQDDPELHMDQGLVQEENVISVEGIETTVEETEGMILGEEVEADQLTYLLHIDENGQQVMVPATEEDLAAIRRSQEEGEMEGQVHEIVDTNEDLLQVGQRLLQQFESGDFPPQEQDNVIVQSPMEDVQPVQEEGVDQLHDIQVEMVDGAASQTEEDLTDAQNDQVVIQETVMMDPEGGDQQFIYQDTDGSVHTVVEVEHPSDSGPQQYAILVLPEGESGAEPEAALSMLQLQSSMQQ